MPAERVELTGAGEDDRVGKGRRHELDDRKQVRGVARVGDQTPCAARKVGGDLARRQGGRRGGQRDTRLGALVELAEERALELVRLRRALLHVCRTGERRRQVVGECDPRRDLLHALVEQPARVEAPEASREVLQHCAAPLGIRLVDDHSEPGSREDDRPTNADPAPADDGDAAAEGVSLNH